MPKSNFSRWLPALLAGAALFAPAVPAAAVTDFQLPPNTTRPRAQGPVDAGESPPRTATPSPSPMPAPAPSSPVPVIRVPEAVPAVAVPSAGASPRPAAQPTSAAPTASISPAAEPASAPTAMPAFNPLAQDRPPVAAGEPPVKPAAQPAPANDIAPWWPWAAGGIALLAILGGMVFLLAQRRNRRAQEAPEIERPIVQRPVVPPSSPAAQAAPPPPAPTAEVEPEHGPLSMAMEARELTISFGAATLAYRITLTNTGRTALDGVEISGDLVSAHASLALEDQLATAEAALAQKHEIDRIRPGESVQVNGEFRLPMQAIHPIVQGTARLLVPLARLRVHAAQGGNGALIKTALVGQRATRPGAGLQPFRLDLGPRIYREVTQKIF